MQEVKQPNKKPFIFYYLIALVAIMLINSLLVPQIVQRAVKEVDYNCLLYTSPSPRDDALSRMPSSA